MPKNSCNTDDLPDPVREARKALPIEALELLDWPRDLADAAHEHADGHHDVIYYYAAHKLLAECTSDERSDAESDLEDMGSTPSSYDEFATALAYCVIRRRYTDEVSESLTAYRDTLQDERDAIEGLYDIDADDETPHPTLDAIDADLDAIEEILD